MGLLKDQAKFALAGFLLAISVGIASAETEAFMPLDFKFTKVGENVDPTGLWTKKEIRNGGSTVQPSIWFAEAEVAGGNFVMAILVDAWCGAHECPFRARIEVDGKIFAVHESPDYGMVCQDVSSMEIAPFSLILRACGNEVALGRKE